ncbi:MAG: YybS family protein [Bacillota bacterium]
MQNNKTRALVEGAIFASITAVLGIIIGFVPVMGALIYIWPTPIVIVGFRNGLKVSVLSAIASLVIISVFTTPINGISLFLILGLPGIVMGYLLKKNMKPSLVILITAVVLAVIMTLSLIASYYAFAPSIMGNLGDIRLEINRAVEEATNTYRLLGIDEEIVVQVKEQTNQLIELFIKLIPYLVLTSSILFIYINFKFTRLILKRIGYNTDDVKRFKEWRLPERLSKPLMILLVAVLIINMRNIEYLGIVINLLQLIMFVYTVLGLSVALYYLDILAAKYELPKAIKTIAVVIGFLTLGSFLPAVGLMDSVMDLRKWASKPKEV